MLADTLRMEAYYEALRRTVRPGSIVVDLGCGPGLFALFACRLGAKRVYAIEPGNSLQLARDLAAANGYSDRIEFIQDFSTNVTLPERADVIVADLRGLLPQWCRSIPSMMDARDRLLAAGGVMIPQRDYIWGTVVENPDFYGRHVLAWDRSANGFDLSAAREMSANTIYKIRCNPGEVLAAPALLGQIDYMGVGTSRFEAEHRWTPTRAGDVHGICLWFDTTLIPPGAGTAVGFSNSPDLPELIYGNTFFPLPEPVHVDPEDCITTQIRADLVGDDYVWRWNTRIRNASFAQSTFFSNPITPESLQRAR